MNRRDTIIIAVLVNAGLLVVLLSTALKKEDGTSNLVLNETVKTPVAIEMPLKKDVLSSTDEVDQVLKEYSHTTAKGSDSIVNQKDPSNDNFVRDLQALTTQPQEQAAKAVPTLQDVIGSTMAPSSNETVEVVVKKGDALEKIAKSHGTSVESIMTNNSLTSTRLKIGQVIRINPKLQIANRTPSLQESKTPLAKAPTIAKSYVVKKGDNPWTIAVKNHMKVDELLKINNLNDETARRLKPGDKLKIR